MSQAIEREWSGTGLAGADAVAAHLDISLRHFKTLKKDGRFGPSPIHLGGAVRFSQAEVDAWITAGMPRREVWAVVWGRQQLDAATATKKGRGR